MYQKQHKARQDHLCAGCQNIIEKGTQYHQVGLIPKNKDYHEGCLPKVGPTPVAEAPVPTPETKPEVKTNPTPQTQNPGTKPARDVKGHFIKKGSD